MLNIRVFTVNNKLERVRKEGISIECHYITTSDGYILRLYHMPPQPNATDAVDAADTDRKPLKPIFFMHGLQSSSLDYVIYPNISSGEYSTSEIEFSACPFFSSKSLNYVARALVHSIGFVNFAQRQLNDLEQSI